MTKKRPTHLHNAGVLLVVPIACVLSSTIASLTGSLAHNLGGYDTSLALYATSILLSALGLGATLPAIARTVEYSKLTTLLSMKNIKQGKNVKADKYLNAMSITDSHMRTLALAFSSLPKGNSYEEELDFIRDTLRQRPRLKKHRLFSKDWWAAQFSPLALE